MLTLARSLLLSCSLLAAGAAAQTPAPAATAAPAAAGRAAVVAGTPVPDQWIVTFQARSFDLEPFRNAILARAPVADVDALVAHMEAQTRADRAAFVTALERLGGRVLTHWWIINGAAVSLAAARVDELRALPGVAEVVPDRWYPPSLIDATNASHHDSDGANLRDARAGGKVTGTGIGIAVLDTGCDGNMGGSGRPHRLYYPGGNTALPSNLAAQLGTSGFGSEDVFGHGTFVQSCAAGNRWNALSITDNAPAFNARIVSLKISDNGGGAQANWLITGWQQVATDRTRYNLAVANNSYSGSPSLSDPVQVALDQTAFSADVMIVCAAGNFGSDTSASQCVFNGLAVGSIDKYTRTVSSFSARGPLFGTTRTYPDLVAVGNGVYGAANDNENGTAQSGGTSFASPMVAGGAALVRQADARITALQCKAILLNTTVPGGTRNDQGLGMLKCTTSVDAALAGDYQTVRLTNPNQKVANLQFTAQANVPRSVTVTWMREYLATPHNIDLRIFDAGNNQVAADLNRFNGYEKVTFTPAATGTFRAEITWVNFASGNVFVDVGVCGVGPGCAGTPQLASLSAATPPATHAPAVVTVTGSGLSTAFEIGFGGVQLPLTVLSDTQVRFTTPRPAQIGNVPVTVRTMCGTSNALQLTVAAANPPVLSGPGIVLRGPTLYRYELFSDANWQSLLFLSTSNVPSVLPGVVSLGIGNVFSDLFQLGVFGHDARGYTQLNLSFPTFITIPGVFFQAIAFDPSNIVLPLTVTNVQPSAIF